jgi:hypothetical protein
MNDQGSTGFDPFARLNLRLRVGDHIIDRGSLRVVNHRARVRLTGKSDGSSDRTRKARRRYGNA